MADHSETINFIETALTRLLPEGATMHGAVTSDRPQQLLIEGRFTGRMELDASSRVVIAAGAEVEAEVLRAHTVVVRGLVKGTIHAEVVEIAATARVAGVIRYDAGLNIEPGARVRASIEGPEF